jgi:hypothetical protein
MAMIRNQKTLKKENAAERWEFEETCVAFEDASGNEGCDEITS